MPNAFLRSFNDNDASLTRKIITIGTLLIAANVAAWAWALDGVPRLSGAARHRRARL